VVPNKYPALRTDEPLVSTGHGTMRACTGFGLHEVIIESPQHLVSPTEMAPEDLALVLRTICDRSRLHSADERLTYVMVFKNVGEPAGATIEHAHSQLIAVPVMPRRVQEEMARCTESFHETGRCLFCDIVEEERASGARIVSEDDDFVVLCPYAARFPFEMWLLPRFHAPHFFQLSPERIPALARALQDALARLEVCLQDPPYNYVVHTAPARGVESGHYHWHIEVIPRVTEVAGFEWGTGFYINPLEPERAAEYLRAVTPEQVLEKVSARSVPAAGAGRDERSEER